MAARPHQFGDCFRQRRTAAKGGQRGKAAPVETADAEPSRCGCNPGGDEFGAARLDHRREGLEIHEVDLGLIGGNLLRERRFQALEPIVVEETRQVHDAVAVVVLSLLLGDFPHGVRQAFAVDAKCPIHHAAVKLTAIVHGWPRRGTVVCHRPSALFRNLGCVARDRPTARVQRARIRETGLSADPWDRIKGGGSIGFADPQADIGFGYLMNKMQMVGPLHEQRHVPGWSFQ